MTRRILALYAGAAAGLCLPATAHAAPEDRGPHEVATWVAGSVPAAGAQIPVTVYHPAALPQDGPGPLVGVIHGWARTGHFQTELAQTLASRGFVAVVPDMPCGFLGCDHNANARQISALLDWAARRSADADSPIHGLADPTRRGLTGHSWGGLSSFLAGTEDDRISSVVLLDPNDDLRVAVGKAGDLSPASAHVMAQVRGTCNNDWADSVFPNTPAPHLRVRIAGSGHCDVEDPSDGLCDIACSAGDRATSPLFRRYAVAFTACNLLGDRAMAPWIGGAELSADEAAGAIDRVAHEGLADLPCNAPPPEDPPPPPDDPPADDPPPPPPDDPDPPPPDDPPPDSPAEDPPPPQADEPPPAPAPAPDEDPEPVAQGTDADTTDEPTPARSSQSGCRTAAGLRWPFLRR